MFETVKILPHYTYEDYLHWEGKWEVIDGIPYAMNRAPTPVHQRISSNMAAEFGTSLRAFKEYTVYLPIDYVPRKDTILQPDLLIVCKEIKKKFLDFAPSLVVEILSPATALKDRHTNYAIYQQQGIKYYIIVDPDTKEAEVYQFENSIYQLKQKGTDFSFQFELEDCSATINFKEIW